MAKYRRFVGNPKGSKQRMPPLSVRNRRLGVNFGPPVADLICPFARHGLRTANAIVTDPSRNDGAFQVIPSETTRQNRHFCRSPNKKVPQAIEPVERLARAPNTPR
jgi:hypothetical protein